VGQISTGMDSRAALFVALCVAFASLHDCVDVADERSELDSLTEGVAQQADVFLQERAGMEPATVTVTAAKNPAIPPAPTIKSLMPKHLKEQTAAFQAKNGGKEPDAAGKQDVHRLAVQSAAKEINDQEAAKEALEEAAKKMRKLRKKVMRDRSNIKIVENNEAYAAKKAFQAEDRKVRYIAVKSEKRSERAAEQLKKIKKNAAKVTQSMTNKQDLDEAVVKARKRYVEANDKLKVADQSQYKAKTILAKSEATINNARQRVQRKTQFLENVESYKAKQRLEYRTAKIMASYEKQHAKSVKVKLAALSAKKDAVFKFVKGLDEKSKRDYAAAEASIEKSKDDFAVASQKLAEHSARAKLYQKKYDKAVKLAEESRMGVVEALDAKEQNTGTRHDAITSSRNYNRLKKSELRDKETLDKENIDAKGQKDMIKVAQTDLLEAQGLKTQAAKQKELVVQKKITINAQLEKIDYLKAEVKKHLRKGDDAQKRARDALHKVKNMEKDAILSKNEAVAQQAYAKKIDIPIALTALKKANIAVETEEKYETDERDDIKQLETESATQVAQIKAIGRQRRKNAQQLKVKIMKAAQYKNRLAKAEAKRDAVLTANNAKIKALKSRLDQADANFKAAVTEGKKKEEKAPATELGDPIHLDASGGDVQELEQ